MKHVKGQSQDNTNWCGELGLWFTNRGEGLADVQFSERQLFAGNGDFTRCSYHLQFRWRRKGSPSLKRGIEGHLSPVA
jgi:hypothetical protein